MTCRTLGLLFLVLVPAAIMTGDTLELKNGSVIKGTYVGGTDSRISFRVGSSVQQYAVADVSSLKFDDRESAAPTHSPGFAERAPENAPAAYVPTPSAQSPAPNSTCATTSNSIPRTTSQSWWCPVVHKLPFAPLMPWDSDKNHPGDKFQASLEQPLVVNDVTVAPKGATYMANCSRCRKQAS